ncbi:MAG: hypothetical protein NUV63_14475 [Gallionella sp.]|nr:hypothetical protein [Gallionella sp.]
MNVVIFLILAAVVAYYFLRKKERVEFVAETLVNDDLFRKYNDLMKESTVLKKAGKFPVGHFKIPQHWPPKIPQAGRADYELVEVF